MSDDRMVTINGKQYELSPLKMKALKEISRILTGTSMETLKKGVYDSLERWSPFIVDSIKVKSPDFKVEELEEATLQEFMDAWQKLGEISGIKLVNKGETKPTAGSTGSSSTDVSAPPSAGTTVQ